ncbi:hypothetical protein BGW38_001843, partial [Lunasporangiospora selenospora]
MSGPYSPPTHSMRGPTPGLPIQASPHHGPSTATIPAPALVSISGPLDLRTTGLQPILPPVKDAQPPPPPGSPS